MRHSLVWSLIIIALLAGAAISYYDLQESRATTTTTTLASVSTIGEPMNLTEQTRLACGFLVSNFNSTLGLVSETATHQSYFLYSDNFLAAMVLSKDCGRPDLSQAINQTLSRYDSSTIPNQYMVFDCKQFLNNSQDFKLSGQIWTTINNQSGKLGDDYADIAFLQAYYDQKCAGDTAAALAAFQSGSGEFNGIGLNDTAYRAGPGPYQTYKLALYLYVASTLGQKAPAIVLPDMLKVQNQANGGFYTGYNPDLTTNGTTNTETTSLAIMAMQTLNN